MKIKLVIIENDVGYLNRIVSVFGTKYADKFEIYSFTDKAVALPAIAQSRIDVVLVSDSIDIDPSMIPPRCGFAYFVDSVDVETFNDQPTVCRFQKADLIYKQILSIYAEHAGNYTGLKLTDDGCKVIAFASPSGGAGSSTMAAACAIHLAAKGYRTLYLNLETFGSADDFFAGEGQYCMSDVIYALKTKKANISMKLESCVKKDKNGVSFFSSTKLVLDMLEVKPDEILRLISELRLTGSYDYIILDCEFDLSAGTLGILHDANTLVMVGDGSTVSNTKLFRAITALSMKEHDDDSRLIDRTVIAYNKFSSKTGSALSGIEIKAIGGAPRYEHATVEQILEQLSKMTLFNELD